MKTILTLVLLLAINLFSSTVYSEPTSGAATIYAIRPYIGGNWVYLTIAGLPAICQTTVFTIDLGKPNGKAAYTAALAAMLTKSQVMLEISNATGWATELQSISVFTH